MLNHTDSQSLLLERLLSWLLKKGKEYAVPAITAFVTGILAHFFAFSNKLINYDDVGSLFDKGTTTTSGRWGLDLMGFLFPNYSMPWIYGILSIALLTAAVCIIVYLFSIRSKLLQGLVAGSVLAFPSLIGTIAFMYTLSSYALAFLLIVLSVYFIHENWKRYCLPAALCLILSVAIYQSYISIAASLLVLILIQQLLQGEDVLKVLRRGIGYVIFLIAALGSYFLLTQVINRALGIQFNIYAAERMTFSLSYLPTGIFNAYRVFLNYFTDNYWGLIPTPPSSYIHYLCIAAAVVLLGLWAIRQPKKEIGRYLLLSLLLILLPLAINCIYLFVSADPRLSSAHTLVIYSFVAVYILAAIVADLSLENVSSRFQWNASQLSRNIVTLGMAAVIIINTYIANEVYLSMYLRYENAYAFYSNLLADVKKEPEFTPGTEIALIGEWNEPYYYYDEFPFTYSIMGTKGFLPTADSKFYFLQYYMGVTLHFADGLRTEELAALEEVQEMPGYPYYGSVKMVDDVLVVKLS